MPDNLIPLTCNEIARPFITLIAQRVHDTACTSHPCWSSAASNWLARPSAAAKERWSW